MNGRIFGMLGFSALCGLLAAWYASSWLTNVETSVRQAETIEMETVVVAARDVPFGVTFDETMLALIEMPVSQLPKNVITSQQAVLGKFALRPFLEGEMIVPDRVGDSMSAGMLAARIQPGMRAISVRVDAVTGVAGFVMPGDRVDILSLRSASGQEAYRSSLLLQNMRVLAVDQDTDNEAGRPNLMNTVTFEATPDEAEILALADRVGALQLILRNPGELASSYRPRQQLQILRGTEQDVIEMATSVQPSQTDELLSSN